MNAESFTFVSQINWSQPTWDLFIALIFIVATFIYGISLGRDRIIVILVSLYMSLAVVNAAPFLDLLERQSQEVLSKIFVFKITGFLGIFIVLFFFLSRSALLRTIASHDERGSWWQVVLFSILHVGLLTSVILSFIPHDAITRLAPLTQQIFTGHLGRFAWIIAPIIAMILVRKKDPKKDRAM